MANYDIRTDRHLWRLDWHYCIYSSQV